MFPLISFFLLWICVINSEPCQSDRLWYSTQHLLDKLSGYSISLRVSGETLHLVLEIGHLGWMGFGIAEQSTGTMLGSDIVTVYVKDGEVIVDDRHTMWYPSNWPVPPAGVFPEEDIHNDWTVVAGFEVHGKTAVHLTRPLSTGDPQDRDIRHGPQRIIWAHGIDDEVVYHETHRGVGAIVFIPDDGSVEEERTEVTQEFPKYDGMVSIRIQYTIPEVRTAYGCQAFRLPDDKRRHIVAIRPKVDKAQAVVMGTVYLCRESKYWSSLQKGQSCLGARPLSSWDNDCQGIMFTWARAGEEFILPPDVGIPMGPRYDAANTIILEIHYDNPTLLSGQVDTSGLDFYFIERPRESDAGILMLGDATLKFAAIPPRSPAVHRESTCPSQCTAQFDGPIHVFGSVFHMRSTGRKMYTTHFNQQKEFQGVTNRADFWRMGVRPFTPRSYEIKPGDSLHTHCWYNTTLKTSSVAFGSASADEICAHYIFYYPAQFRENRPFTFCGWSPGDETLCANDDDSWPVIMDDTRLQQPDTTDNTQDPTHFGQASASPLHPDAPPTCDPGDLTDIFLRNSSQGTTIYCCLWELTLLLLAGLYFLLP